MVTDGVAAIVKILARPRLSPRVQSALILICEGASYREACRLAGLKATRAADLHENAERLGLLALHLQRREQRALLRVPQREAELYERLMGRGRRLTPKQLSRASDLAFDRVLRVERARRPSPPTALR
jgi:hypothetical protein